MDFRSRVFQVKNLVKHGNRVLDEKFELLENCFCSQFLQ